MDSEELLTLVIVVALISATVIGISMYVNAKMSNSNVNGKWIIYSTSPSLEGTDNTYKIGDLSVKLEAITAVDYFYKTSGERGIVGVKLIFKNESTNEVFIPLEDAYFINSHGRKITTELMSGYKEFSPTPNMLRIKSSQKREVSIVAKGSQRHVVVNNIPMWVVTLLAKENEKMSFSLPILENGKEKFYKFSFEFVKK